MTTATAAAPVAAVKPIKQEVINVAEAIKKDLTLDPKTGVATVGADLYERLLPEGITTKMIAELNAHNSVIAAAGLLALGETAVPAMKKHKELDRATLQIPTVGKDAFGFTFDRSRQVPDRGADGSTGTKTKYGSGSVEFSMYGVKSRGDLLKVKSQLAESALKAFGG